MIYCLTRGYWSCVVLKALMNKESRKQSANSDLITCHNLFFSNDSIACYSCDAHYSHDLKTWSISCSDSQLFVSMKVATCLPLGNQPTLDILVPTQSVGACEEHSR